MSGIYAARVSDWGSLRRRTLDAMEQRSVIDYMFTVSTWRDVRVDANDETAAAAAATAAAAVAPTAVGDDDDGWTFAPTDMTIADRCDDLWIGRLLHGAHLFTPGNKRARLKPLRSWRQIRIARPLLRSIRRYTDIFEQARPELAFEIVWLLRWLEHSKREYLRTI